MFTYTFLCPSRTTLSLVKEPLRPISICASSKSPSPQVLTFWQWLKEEGIVSAKTPVKPAIVQEGLGLIALRDIAKNDVVLEVPRRLWINPDAAAASEVGSLCSGLKPWVSVALFLIKERLKEDSLWRVYFDILPQFTNSTIFWSENELAELQGTQLLNTTLNVKEYVQNEFSKVKEIILSDENLFPNAVTFDDFLWAFGVLRSRAFSRLRGQNLVMIPGVDLINHSSSVTTEDHAHEINGPAGLFSWDLLFSLRSPIDVKAGEQVYIQYGLKKSNAELALDYGFIESSTLNRDTYTMTLEMPDSDPFYADKLEIAESNGLEKTAYFDISMDNSIPPEMLKYLRLVVLEGADGFFLESVFRNTIWGILDSPISRDNEELVCRVVREICKSALSGYRTSNEEDMKLMARGNLDSRFEMAIKIRLAEKKILEQVDKVFAERELRLNQLEYYQERRLKELAPCKQQ
ncbi:hypothetical protein ACFE04_022999 [Oxalis oulophora]